MHISGRGLCLNTCEVAILRPHMTMSAPGLSEFSHAQTIAFVHGHQHSWHSLDMLENLKALRWDLVTQHRDLNRIMPVWTHRVGLLDSMPEATVIAELPASYNGSYNVNQVSSSCLQIAPCCCWPTPMHG